MISALRLDGCLDFQNASQREVRGERRLGWKWDFCRKDKKKRGWKKDTSQVGRTTRWGKELRPLCSSPSISLITVQLTHLFQHAHLPSISSSVLRAIKPGSSDQSVCWGGLKPSCDQFSSTCRPFTHLPRWLQPPAHLWNLNKWPMLLFFSIWSQLSGLHTHGQTSCFGFLTEPPWKDWDQLYTLWERAVLLLLHRTGNNKIWRSCTINKMHSCSFFLHFFPSQGKQIASTQWYWLHLSPVAPTLLPFPSFRWTITYSVTEQLEAESFSHLFSRLNGSVCVCVCVYSVGWFIYGSRRWWLTQHQKVSANVM